MTSPVRRKHLPLALALGLGLMLLSYVRILGDSQSKGFREEVIENIFGGRILGTALMWNLIWFALALVFVHFAFGALCWMVGTRSASVFPPPDPAAHEKNRRQHVILWFALLTVALLTYNSSVFSRSSLGSPYARVMGESFMGIELGTLIACLIALAAIAVTFLATHKALRAGWRPYRDPRRFAAAAGAVAALFAIIGWATANHSHNDASKPNVVLIGIDSLRTDIVARGAPAGLAPQMREFLGESVWFTDCMTPLARTFPSVSSILTGRQPHKTGAYMNLPPRDFVKEGETIGRIFQNAGYHSVFAMDEVRFANFDESYGFNQVVTPPPGATEFLTSLFADTPLSNLVMNTRLGAWLFPYIHANRGAATTYDPDTFNARVEREVDFDKPLFLATHLTLSHWPYTWAGAPLPNRTFTASWPTYYVDVIQRVDEQFGDLMEMLRERGVLDNAIVVLYSDHGESFGHPGESLVPDRDPLIRGLAAVPQWGHGSTVLTAHQYKVVLGMRAYGAAANLLPTPRQIDAPTSVMDIAPTVAQLAGAKTTSAFDGVSLVSLLADNATLPPEFAHRVRFTETEYTPVGVATPDGKMSASGIAKAAEMYNIDPVTDRVAVRPEHLVSMLGIRQYAAVGDEYLLAAVPYRADGLSHQFLVVPKDGGEVRLLLNVPNAESPDDLRRVWDAMQMNFAGIVPTAELLEKFVGDTAVAQRGQAVTLDVTK